MGKTQTFTHAKVQKQTHLVLTLGIVGLQKRTHHEGGNAAPLSDPQRVVD